MTPTPTPESFLMTKKQLHAEIDRLKKENERMREALQDIVAHTWAAQGSDADKWAREFVEVAQQALKPEEGK